LRIFVLRGCALGLSRFAIVEIIARACVFPDAIFVIQPDVEPDRAVKGAMLIGAKPGQFVVEDFGCFRVGEITVREAAICDRAGDAMDQLPNGGLATAFMRVGAVGDVAVEVFGNRDLGCERAPVLWDLDLFLFENNLAAVVGDLRRPTLPFQLLKRRHRWVAKDTLKTQAAIFFRTRSGAPRKRFAIFDEGGGLQAGFELDHG
jgi:hypothetical protein